MSASNKDSVTQLVLDRQAIVDYLNRKLVGPSNGDNEALLKKDVPHTYYLMGAVFPQGVGMGDLSGEEEGDQTEDDPIALAYQLKPASIGLSFFVTSESTNPTVTVELAAAVYELLDGKWERRPLATREKPYTITLDAGAANTARGTLNGRVDVVSRWRKMSSGHLVTVTLLNPRHADEKLNPTDVLHQVWMRCKAERGAIGNYPGPNRFSWDEEEEELALIYQNKRTFAIGHGCAANWPTDRHYDVAPWIETAFIPEFEVPPVTADLPEGHELSNNKVFSLQYLADSSVDWQEKYKLLTQFITSYECWVAEQLSLNAPNGLENAAERIGRRLEISVARMIKGLEYLNNNEGAKQCFLLANQAMLMQMIHSGKGYGGTQKAANSFIFERPDYTEFAWSNYRWRPFQLAFQLLAIESVGNSNSDDRELADLIWFPTGGGKTEAYLAVTAFELFHRRYQFGETGGGTAILLRYTLRLLTTQQFERAAAMICACESLRRKDSEAWGNEPFSLGLWVGQGTTPNTFSNDSDTSPGAYQVFKELCEAAKPENPFQLLSCPWCGSRLVPEAHSDNAKKYGFRVSASSFEIFCTTETCDFHNQIPVQVVDEGLYASPPSFLIGTIDKFARLAWRDEPSSFFNGGRHQRKPPSLVLQDELHLISGPLGTIAGIYEAAIDVVMRRHGANPKYIAATATIRRADEQVERLYARPCNIFPPAGMRVEDSWFSREQNSSAENPGRLYVGIMGQYHTPVTSLVQTSAALAQSVIDVPLGAKAADGYWTQVVFHNSRRELGKTMTMALDDIPKRAEVIAQDRSRARKIQPTEMSANIPSREIPEVLEALKTHRESGSAIDMLPCTNMFSVGVDVKRLGLIMMNGQPKTTAEYIQASSRVGRDIIPGLVVALYPNNKARDRSQYESFIPYHQALYRAVEPTSVTPYAQPAMERALHAALIIVMRYAAGLSGIDGAKRFDPDEPTVADAIETLRSRMLAADPTNSTSKASVNSYLDQCVQAWADLARCARDGNIQLRYESRNSSNMKPLIVEYTPGASVKPEVPWPTLNSMRNVDRESKIYVWGED
ncbi:helicase-related protein [Lacimicrobium alkaliphilum]|uniref:Helicase C-terminal domain-containing protein n=1 Tax=Lacimicrobium alkaliphilum TaxID=1526571 RepID=A0ABQ1R8L7_9ALTE|nr:helicase-related protein [Lacimicrobium alkaliphilum]GGD59606.1 hypothetical protein GCM10011357_13640 [Lacimicrobium alkaliphilum]